MEITKIFGLQFSEDVRKQVCELQRKKSFAFRSIYNNLDLIADDNFKQCIISKYLFSAKAYEYVVSEAIAVKEAREEQSKELQIRIDDMRGELFGNKFLLKRAGLQSDISRLRVTINSNPVFGTKDLLQDISNQIKDKDKQDLYLENLSEYREKRLMMLYFKGEKSRNGNRFFDFSHLSQGEILFKYEATDIKIPIKFAVKTTKEKKLLETIGQLALNKKMTLSVRFDRNEMHITYDLDEVKGVKFDKKKEYLKIRDVADEQQRKDLLQAVHKGLDDKLIGSKNKNIFATIDINPSEIGLAIGLKLSDNPSGDFEVLAYKLFKYEQLIGNDISADKRNYELSIVIKKMFCLLRYWGVSTLGMENLDITAEDHGNRELNRQVNNKWNKELIHHLCQRRCLESGIKFDDKLNPAYSSFVGNVNYNIIDPCAAATELLRRTITHYIKGNCLLPVFNEGVIADAAKAAQMDYNDLVHVKSWKGLKKAIDMRSRSVRRKSIEKYSFSVKDMNGTKKSLVKEYLFL